MDNKAKLESALELISWIMDMVDDTNFCDETWDEIQEWISNLKGEDNE